jgi:MFS family permease
MMPVFAMDILHVGSDGQGMLMGVSGSGALAVSLLMGRTGTFGRARLFLIGGSMVFGLTLSAFALTSLKFENYYLAMILMFVMGVSNSTYLISIMSTIQLLVPDNMRGRVMGFHGMTWSIMPLGAMYVGGLAGVLGGGSDGVASTVAVGGVLVSLFSLACGLLNSNLRGIDQMIRSNQKIS